MRYVLGIDLGTSSLKAVLLREDGRVVAAATESYPIDVPRPGWAEQNPDAWWAALCAAVPAVLRAASEHPSLPESKSADTQQPAAGDEGREASSPVRAADVAAVAVGGQMHGAVLLDERGAPLRPAIIWPDQRAGDEAATATQELAARGLIVRLGGGVSPGFMLASLLWLRRHEPALWARVAAALLPKDYLRYRLTGELSGEPSDGTGIPLIDLWTGTWSTEALDVLDLPARLFPPLGPSTAIAGAVTPAAAAATGLCAGTPVYRGGSDQAMSALGSGLLEPGTLLLSLSTGGQIVTPLDRPLSAPERGLRTLCHALPGRYLALTATLGAGLSLRWLRDTVFTDRAPGADGRIMALAAAAPPGAGGLLFLPYLAGERAPLLDPRASGAFVGLRLDHGRPHLARAVLEGIALGVRHALDPLHAAGVHPPRVLLAGGLTRDPLMRQIVADALDQEVRGVETGEQAALGAALIAAVGAGFFHDLNAACAATVAVGAPTAPDAARVGIYASLYERYRDLYPKLRDDMHALRRLGAAAAPGINDPSAV